MAQMPPVVRILTAPVGRSADKAAAALSDLVSSGRHTTTTGAFYKLTQAAKPPKASLNTASQRRLWADVAALLGIDTAETIGASR